MITTIPAIHTDRVALDTTTLKAQITIGGLMTVGASDLVHATDALIMKARIHPRKADGARAARPRVMDIMITLSWDDTYSVSVTYRDARKGIVTHWEMEGLYGDSMARVFLSLDSGTESR